jgi:hypothetical protein
MPVLAVLTMEIAPDTPERVRECPGKKMEKWLFLDRVYRFSAYLSKCGCVKCPVPVKADTADAMLSVLYVTPVAAERTFNFQVFSFPVLPCFVPVFHQEENKRADKDKSAGGRRGRARIFSRYSRKVRLLQL